MASLSFVITANITVCKVIVKPVYDTFQKAKHEAELVIFEVAQSTLLAMKGDEKLPSLKTLQANIRDFLKNSNGSMMNERSSKRKHG